MASLQQPSAIAPPSTVEAPPPHPHCLRGGEDDLKPLGASPPKVRHSVRRYGTVGGAEGGGKAQHDLLLTYKWLATPEGAAALSNSGLTPSERFIILQRATEQARASKLCGHLRAQAQRFHGFLQSQPDQVSALPASVRPMLAAAICSLASRCASHALLTGILSTASDAAAPEGRR